MLQQQANQQLNQANRNALFDSNFTSRIESSTLPITSDLVLNTEVSGPLTDRTSKAQNTCNNLTIENVLNIFYRQNYKCYKTFESLNNKPPTPCLFNAAKRFGGSECSGNIYNTICRFHWNMIGFDVIVMENYLYYGNETVNQEHYEFVINDFHPNESFTPIFPFISSKTTVFDLLFGFTHANNIGKKKTGRHEGVAMAYALYYQINPSCDPKWTLISQQWIEAIGVYLMSFVLQNSEFIKKGLVSSEQLCQNNMISNGNVNLVSILKRFFSKTILVSSVSQPIERPTPAYMNSVCGTGANRNVINSVKIGDYVRLVNSGTLPESSSNDVPIVNASRHEIYQDLNIFNAPIVMALRSSTHVLANGILAEPMNVMVFDVNFASEDGRTPCTVFGIVGPILYAIPKRLNSGKRLPYTNDLIHSSMVHVATLGGTSNADIASPRIFSTKLNFQKPVTIDVDNITKKFKIDSPT